MFSHSQIAVVVIVAVKFFDGGGTKNIDRITGVCCGMWSRYNGYRRSGLPYASGNTYLAMWRDMSEALF